MNITIRLISLVGIILAASAVHAQSDGDQFDAAAQSVVQSLGTASMERMADEAAQMQDPEAYDKVILYRTSWCGYCKRASAYLHDNNIPFVERDIEKNALYGQQYKRLGGRGVPFMICGSRVLRGFDPDMVTRCYAGMHDRRDGELHARAYAPGYPGGPPVIYPGMPPGAYPSMPPVDSALQVGEAVRAKYRDAAIFAEPANTSRKVAVLGFNDSAVYMGQEQNGFYLVNFGRGEGWVSKLIVKRP